MKVQLSGTELLLARRQTLNLADPAGVRITARRGSLWVTQDRDRRDIVLRAGESITFAKSAPVIVQALDAARVALAQTAAAPRMRLERASGWRYLLAGMRGFLPAPQPACR